MSSIVYSVNPTTGNKFAYETFSYIDPDTKKAKTGKRYLGRVDPDTGAIIAKGTDGKRTRRPSTKQIELAAGRDNETIDSLRKELDALKAAFSDLTEQNQAKDDFISTVLKAAAIYSEKKESSSGDI